MARKDTLKCITRTQRSGKGWKVVAECSECPGPSTILDPVCFKGILSALSELTNVHEVICADLIETAWGHEVVPLLFSMSELKKYIESSSERSPAPADGNLRECSKCEVSPDRLFSSLEESLGPDLSYVKNHLAKGENALAGRLQGSRCGKCAGRSLEELRIVRERITEIEERCEGY